MFEKQLEAFEKFSKLKVGALFMQMGSGKTKVALELVKHNNVDFMLYITPYSTKANIQEEIDKWNINCDYEIIGYETIQSSDKEYLRILKKLENKRNFIIADESIFIKNEETKRFKRLCQLRNKCEYALILNGTPLTKNEWDLYNQMFFLSPLIIKMNRNDFLNTFFKKIIYKKRGEKENTFYKFSEINANYLYKLIDPYIFKCDLNFKKQEKETYNYIKYEGDKYNLEKERKYNEYIKYKNGDAIISLLTNLNVISSVYNKKNDEIIKYINNKRIIVYCSYLSEIEYIKGKCDCFVITGKTKNRKEIFDKFKNNCKPLLLTFGVGSYSFNLQYCNEIVYSSLNFDYGKIEQSKFRIKRIGQEKDIQYTYFLTNLGINKIILENLKKKKTLEELIKEKIKEGELEKWIKNL